MSSLRLRAALILSCLYVVFVPESLMVDAAPAYSKHAAHVRREKRCIDNFKHVLGMFASSKAYQDVQYVLCLGSSIDYELSLLMRCMGYELSVRDFPRVSQGGCRPAVLPTCSTTVEEETTVHRQFQTFSRKFCKFPYIT